MLTGIVGGTAGYHLLRWLGRRAEAKDYCTGTAYRDRSKVETLFGSEIWSELRGRVVIDFGCGAGEDAIEVARRGAKKVIGIDIRQNVLEVARGAAAKAGFSDRCIFSTDANEPVDVILSIDSFEHYGDPGRVLKIMSRLLRTNGRVFIAFGPPWLHPLGGHLFSVFPWSHLIFTEKALVRWRSDFKSDGATRFCEVEGGLNRMTIREFRRLLDRSGFEIERFDTVPIRCARPLANSLTRELFTSVVKCRLIRRQRERIMGPDRTCNGQVLKRNEQS